MTVQSDGAGKVHSSPYCFFKGNSGHEIATAPPGTYDGESKLGPFSPTNITGMSVLICDDCIWWNPPPRCNSPFVSPFLRAAISGWLTKSSPGGNSTIIPALPVYGILSSLYILTTALWSAISRFVANQRHSIQLLVTTIPTSLTTSLMSWIASNCSFVQRRAAVLLRSFSKSILSWAPSCLVQPRVHSRWRRVHSHWLLRHEDAPIRLRDVSEYHFALWR